MASPSASPSSPVMVDVVAVSVSPSHSSKISSITTPSPLGRGKKRPASPAINPGVTTNSKKKKIQFTASGQPAPVDVTGEVKSGGGDATSGLTETAAKPQPFKDPNFVHSGIGGAAAGKKNRSWKNLKQIIAVERTLPWKVEHPNYYNIDGPPSMKPAKKYSDISGLPANYTDPQTKLRFASSEEFSYIRLLPTDVVSGYLTLRKAPCIVP
ncbi:INO80 complex subunit C [Clupea harengus]|uniref:INO80 complex subunit C n=1 Tax=Clupea harengus TaxID=7950 RepID=A0A6P3VTE4_CLUHA|nr:INO80 complex subunit C [Clupea harengus]